MGRGLYSGGQPRPHHKGWGSSAAQFLEFHHIYVYTFVAELSNLTW